MNTFFHILQWIVSLIGVAALCYINYFLLIALVQLLWKRRNVRYALLIFVSCMLLATLFQRIRIGFWDWPDVDYQVEEKVGQGEATQ